MADESPREPRRGRIAFVPPRYGTDVLGGSESLSREAAHGLARRGWDVEVLTTCARDHYTWANEYEAGTTVVDGVTVRRFPVVRTANVRAFVKGQHAILGGSRLSVEDQVAWINARFRVPDLYHHLLLHAHDYRAIMFSPYLFWTTLVCGRVAPERTVVIPCLHDEPYAYIDLVRPVLGESAAAWFLSEPEHQLAHRMGAVAVRHAVTGCGIDVPSGYDVDGFRQRHGLHNPFILFSGRREEGKGWPSLLLGFAEAVSRHNLPFNLVTTGVGEVQVPPGLEDRVVDLGFLDDAEMSNAFAAAAAYVQPSRNESFSRTIMEAWLAGTFVIANGESDVVTWHCERSGAGITYRDHFELGQALAFVAGAPKAAAELAAAWRDYVLQGYGWGTGLDPMEESVETLP